jgi:hypothetical protein
MRDATRHHGPDGEGLWISDDRRVGFGSGRLKIIDLSDAANQPMSNEDGSLWLVYDGEIYTHPDIRHELEKLGGHRWKTNHSDTEVIQHAFEQWGIDCVHRFRRMFAFALWDARARASAFAATEAVRKLEIQCDCGAARKSSLPRSSRPRGGTGTRARGSSGVAKPLRIEGRQLAYERLFGRGHAQYTG